LQQCELDCLGNLQHIEHEQQTLESKDGSFIIAVAFTRSNFHRPEEGAQADGVIPIRIEASAAE
jgi:hypothetical protein